MPQYLVAFHHPDDYDPATAEDEAMSREISSLNAEMQAAGVRRFAGGLQAATQAVSVRVRPGGDLATTDGPYLETKEHIGGFWILEVADLDAALAWARKAAGHSTVPTSVRRGRKYPMDKPLNARKDVPLDPTAKHSLEEALTDPRSSRRPSPRTRPI